MKRSDIPNVISVLRIALVAPVIWLLLHEQFGWALVLFAVAGISDGIDGYLAKHFHWQSRLGSILDPLADKLLLVCCYLTLGWMDVLPLWLVAVVLARDVVIISGALVYHWTISDYDMEPMILSKINTFTQIVLVVGVIFNLKFHLLPEVAVTGLVWLTLITTLASGWAYVWVWGKRAWQARQETKGE